LAKEQGESFYLKKRYQSKGATREGAKALTLAKSNILFPCPFLVKPHPCLSILLLSLGQNYNK